MYIIYITGTQSVVRILYGLQSFLATVGICIRTERSNIATIKAWIRVRFNITVSESIKCYKERIT
jgi:hypothetical protein